MSQALPATRVVAVIGAGAMGAGIAQVAAQAGHTVRLLDAREGAAEQAIANIRKMFGKLADKGRMSAEQAEAAGARLLPAASNQEFADAALVVEAIVENLDVKRKLFAELEDIVAADAILATNTSSISVTAIGAALKRPQQLVGMHFFNPAPLMKLVEVVSGLATDRQVAEIIYDTSVAWGKTPVHAKSTPGFIVNRVARPYYAESLRLAGEGAADIATLDAVLREAGGFRMGPFELMDMIGHDVNFAVTKSVWNAFYNDQRFLPSLMQQDLVDAGFLGRKTGRGFYDYAEGADKPQPQTAAAVAAPAGIVLHGECPLAQALASRLQQAGVAFTQQPAQADAAAVQAVTGLLQAAGYAVSVLRDVPGLPVMRTVAMLANEAADAVNQGVCDVDSTDVAMQLGVNYPRGPLAWARQVGLEQVRTVLAHLAQFYGEDRYRVSPWIQQQVYAGDVRHG